MKRSGAHDTASAPHKQSNQKKSKNLLTTYTKGAIIKIQKDNITKLTHKKEIDTMTKKLTKKDHFNALLAIKEVQENPVLVGFIEHELELLAKKNSTASGDKKLTATQKANEELKVGILESMTPNRLYTITEMIKEFPCCKELTNQKVSAIVRQMLKEETVRKVEDKKKALFEKI